MTDTGTFIGGANYDPGYSQGLVDYGTLNNKIAAPLLNAQHSMVAGAGGGWAAATQISARVVAVDTVATGADSVKLPEAIAGTVVYLANNGSASMQVFGYADGDTINGINAYTTGIAQANAKIAIYLCAQDGAWVRVLTA